jgi:metal-responsive CopG/Arc/MetJ family transcriptional regulator
MATTVKTAISLDNDLFKQAEALASEMRVSRSRLIAMALRDYLRRQHDRNLLDRLNAAYAAPLSDDEQATLDEMQSYYFRLMSSEEGT